MARLVGYTRDELETRERVFEGLTSKAVRLSVRTVTANLTGIVTAAPTPTLTEVDQDVLTATWNQHVEQSLYPYLVNTFVDSAAETHGKLEELTDESVPKVDYDFATQYLRKAHNRLVGIGDVIWQNMREQLAEGYQEGDTTQQLATRLRAVASISEPRALMIARTEIVPAANFASLHQVQLAGFTDDEVQKGWLATEDQRTRPEHHAADGQRVPLSQPFTVDGEKLNFPGDWSLGATADNVINCRCSIEFVFVEDITTADANFEALHPRADDGRFGHKPTFNILPKELRGKSGDAMYAPGMFGKYGGAGVMMRHVDSSGTARYMVVQRATGKYNKWRWQLPGGAREQNETAVQAAAREANEEIGLTPEQLATLTPRGAHVVRLPVEGKDPWTYSSVVADAPEAFKPKIDYGELGAARWLTYDQLVEMRGRDRLIAPFAAQLEDIIAKFDEPQVAGFGVTDVTTSDDVVGYYELMTSAGKPNLPDPDWDESKVKRDTEGKFAKKASAKITSVSQVDDSFGGPAKTPAKKTYPKKKTAAEIKAQIAKIKDDAKAAQVAQQPVGTGQVAVAAKPIHINTNVIYKQKYADGTVVAEKPGNAVFAPQRILWSEKFKKFVVQTDWKNDGNWVDTKSYGKGDAYKKFSKETSWHEPTPDTPSLKPLAAKMTAPSVTKPAKSFDQLSHLELSDIVSNNTSDQLASKYTLTELQKIRAAVDDMYANNELSEDEASQYSDKLIIAVSMKQGQGMSNTLTLPMSKLPNFDDDSIKDIVAWYKNLTQDDYDALSPVEQIIAKEQAHFFSPNFAPKLDKFDAAADEEFDAGATPVPKKSKYFGTPITSAGDFAAASWSEKVGWLKAASPAELDVFSLHGLEKLQNLIGEMNQKGDLSGPDFLAANDKIVAAKINKMHGSVDDLASKVQIGYEVDDDDDTIYDPDAELIAKLDKMDPPQFMTWFNQEIPSKAEWNAQTEPVKAHLKTLAQGAKDFFGIAGPINAIDHWSKTKPEPAVLGEPVADVGLPDTALLKNMSAFDFNIWFQSNIDQSMWNGLSDKEKSTLKTLAKKTSGGGFGKPLEDVNAWESGVLPRAAPPAGSSVALVKSIEDMNSSELDTWFDNNFTKSQWDSLDQMQKNMITKEAHSKNAALSLDYIKSWIIKDLTPEQLNAHSSDQNQQLEDDINDLVEKGFLSNQDELHYLQVKKTAAGLAGTPAGTSSPAVGGSKYHVQVHHAIMPISDIGTPESLGPGTIFHKLTPSDAVATQNYMLQVSKKKLTTANVAAVQRYTTSVGYRSTNAVLRDDAAQMKQLSDSDLKAGVKNAVDLQDAMTPLTANVQVYRGTGAHAFGQKGIKANFTQLKKLEGKTITDQGFISTTVLEKPPVSYDYAKKPIQMIVDVPAGSPAAYVSAITPGWLQENELILGAGSTYRIKEVREATAADKAQFGNAQLEHVVHVEIVPSTGKSSHKITSPTDVGKTPKPVNTAGTAGTSLPPVTPSAAVKPTAGPITAKDLQLPMKITTTVIHKNKYQHGAVVAYRKNADGSLNRLAWNESVKKFTLQMQTNSGTWINAVNQSQFMYNKGEAYKTFGSKNYTNWFEPPPGDSAMGSGGTFGTSSPTPKISSPAPTPTVSTPSVTSTAPVKKTKLDAAMLLAMHGDTSGIGGATQDNIFNDFKKGLGYNTHLGTAPEFVFDKLIKVQKKWSPTAKPNLLQILRIVDEKSTPAGATNEHKYEQKIVDWLQTPEGKTSAIDQLNAPEPVPGALPKGAVVSATGEISHATGVYSAELSAIIAKIKQPSAIGTLDPSDTGFVKVSPSGMTTLSNQMLAATPWKTGSKSALTTYTGGSYASINGVLRHDEGKAKYLGEDAKQNYANLAVKMQDGMRPLPKSITVYRKTGMKQFPGLTGNAKFDDVKAFDGKVFIDRGFFSTSVSEGVWSGNVHMTVELPKGVPVAWVKPISRHKGEDELLLAAGLKYRVVSVTKGYGSDINVKLRVEL